MRPLHRTLGPLVVLVGALTVLFLAPPAWAQTGSLEWVRQFGTIGGASDVANAIDTDASGNVYVVGSVPGALPSQMSAGGIDAFIRVYDPDGNHLWTRQFGTVGDDNALAVLVVSDAVYVGGAVGGALPGQSFAGRTDAFVRKYDMSGTLQWDFQVGSTGTDSVRGIGHNGQAVYITGIAFQALPGQNHLGVGDGFVARFDDLGLSAGTAVIRQFGTVGDDRAFGIGLDSTGVYIAGQANGDLDGAGSQTYAGSLDAFVQKWDLALNGSLWTRQFGTALNDVGFGISVDDGVYMAGRTDGDLDGAGSQTYAGAQDAFVRKYDSAGNEIWTRQLGTSAIDLAFAVSVNSTGVYSAGGTEGHFDGADPETSAGGRDIWVAKHDAAGSLQWIRQVGSPGFDQALGIEAGTARVVGQVEGVLPGVDSTRENPGNSDGFIRTYDLGGNDIWSRTFGTLGPVEEFGRAIARADRRGNAYVAGDTAGALPGQTGEGLRDAFVRQYDRTGNARWTRQFGSAVNDFANGLATGPEGGVYVAGRSEGAQPGQTYAGGSSDAYVKLFDSNGNERWTRQFGTGEFDTVNAVASSATGVVAVAGRTDGSLPSQTNPNPGIPDGFLRVYDSEGNEVWTDQFGSSAVEIVQGVDIDPLGNIYVVGQAFGALPGQTSAGAVDAFLRVYDPYGNVLWTRQFGTSLDDLALAVSVGPTEDAYVVGQTAGTLPGQTFAGGAADCFIRAYDRDGNELWTHQFGSVLLDTALAVSATVQGNIYVGGGANAALPGQSSSGLGDGFLRAYDFLGNEQWTLQFGSSGAELVNGVDAFNNGDIHLAGQTNGTLAGQTSAGANDVFVVKLVSVH